MMPIKIDTLASAASYTVFAPGAGTHVDTDTLVLLRDGFDAADGDAAQAVMEPMNSSLTVLSDDASEVIALTPPQRAGIETLRTIRYGDQVLRLQRMTIADNSFVRLLTRATNGQQHATPWARIGAVARLAVGSVTGPRGERTILLEGAQQPLEMQLKP